MKKHLLGIVAIIIAFSAVALPTRFKTDTVYYWYKRTGLNTYAFDVQATNPSVTCSGSTNICAKGFEESQDASTIVDGTAGDTPDRKKS